MREKIINQTTCFNDPYDSIASNYDLLFNNSEFYRIIEKKQRKVLQQVVKDAKNDKLALDVGCGTGHYTRWLSKSGYCTTGIDTSVGMLNVANQATLDLNHSPKFLQMNALELDKLNQKFDVIICLGSTLNHIEDWEAFIKKVSKSLTPHGKFIFSFDNLCGLEILFWLFKKKHNGYQSNERMKIFAGTIKSYLNSIPFFNDWEMKTPDGVVQLHLRYESIPKLKKILKAKRLKIEKTTGAHLLSCFIPSVLNSSTELNSHQEYNGFFEKLKQPLISLDSKASDLFYRLSANIIFVTKKLP